jgi:hypothetical protein
MTSGEQVTHLANALTDAAFHWCLEHKSEFTANAKRRIREILSQRALPDMGTKNDLNV